MKNSTDPAAIIFAVTQIVSKYNSPNQGLQQIIDLLGEGTTSTSINFATYLPTKSQFISTIEYLSDCCAPSEEVSPIDVTYDCSALEFENNGWLEDGGYRQWHVSQSGLPEHINNKLSARKACILLQVSCHSQDRILGVVELWKSNNAMPFTDSEISLAQILTAQMGNLLVKIELYENFYRREKAAKVLTTSSLNLSKIVHLDTLLTRSVETIVNYLDGVHECGILLVSDKNKIQLKATIVKDEGASFYEEGPFEYSSVVLLNLAIKNQEKIFIPDLKSHPFNDSQIFKLIDKGVSSVCYFPLYSGLDLLGILFIHMGENGEQISEAEVEICQSVTMQVSMAINNSQLLEKERERVVLAHRQSNELRILNELAISTANIMGVDDLLYKTIELIRDFVTADFFSFIFLNELTLQYEIHPSAFHKWGDARLIQNPDEKSIVGQVFQSGEVFVSGNRTRDEAHSMFNVRTRSKLTVPLIVQKSVIGVIDLECSIQDAYSKKDVDFVITLAAQVATAIERTKLYEAINNQALNLADQVKLQTSRLKQERDRTVAILECAGEGILITDTNDLIIYANPAFEYLTGYSKEELNQTKSLLLYSYSPNTPSFVLKEIELTISAGRAWSGEIVNQRKDGTLYDVSMTTTPIFAEEELTGYVTVYADISRLKEVERLKAEFVNNVSHELRTPLTGIKTYTALLKRGKPEKRDRYLEVLNYETDRLTQMIQQTLDLSRLDSKKNVVHNVKIDPSLLLSKIAARIEASCEENGRIFETSISPDLPSIMITAHHLEQLLNNLLINAMTFTEVGGRVSLNAHVAQEKIIFQICDNGVGIVGEDIPHVCERFYRGENTIDKNIPGTGLGLSIVEAIVEAYDGRLKITSIPNQITEFIVSFPII